MIKIGNPYIIEDEKRAYLKASVLISKEGWY